MKGSDSLRLVGEPTPPRPDADLIAAGWTRRFHADRNRAQEARELYAGMGLLVKVVPVAPGDYAPACGSCPTGHGETTYLIYTKEA